MTERMENALRHIKTSVDVDPWAVEEVERVFKAYEQTQPQDGDRAISLNAVFDILDGIQTDIEDGDGFNYNKWKEKVNELPSVKPQEKTGHWIGGKYSADDIRYREGKNKWNLKGN